MKAEEAKRLKALEAENRRLKKLLGAIPMTRSEQIEVWLHQNWRISAKGALWQNIRGYNVAVVKKEEDQIAWEWRLTLKDTEDHEYSGTTYSSEESAKRAVLEELADRLGL